MATGDFYTCKTCGSLLLGNLSCPNCTNPSQGYHMNSDNMNRGKEQKHCGACGIPHRCGKEGVCLLLEEQKMKEARDNEGPDQPSKYELLKDWPYEHKGKIHVIKAGCIAEMDGVYLRYPGLDYTWSMRVVENSPDYFRKVEEKKEKDKFVMEIHCIPQAPFQFTAFITTSKGGDLREVQEKIEAALNGDLYTEEEVKGFAEFVFSGIKINDQKAESYVDGYFEKWKEARK